MALVAHGGTIQMLFQCFLRVPADADVWLHGADTGIHLWQVNGDERRILFSNRQDHLAAL